MSIQVFDEAAVVSILNRAFNDVSPANAIFQNQVASAKASAPTYAAFANAFGASFSGVSNAALSKQVLTNMGVLPTTDTSVAALEQALTDYFAAYGSKTVGANGQVAADTRGFIVLQLANILAGLENATGNQAVYKTAALNWNNEVTASYTYSSNTANTSPSPVGTQTLGQTYTLTTGTDAFTGTASDDVFNVTGSGTGSPYTSTFTAFDTIDGGAGNDTLNINDSSAGTPSTLFGLTATGFAVNSIKNIETLNLTSANQLNNINVANITGLTKATFTTSSTNATDITAAKTTDVVVNQLGAAAVTVNGGKTVSITGATATTAATVAESTTGTLTAVTLNKVDGNASLTGTALTNLTVSGATAAARTYTVSNSTASHALTINAAGSGYGADGTTSYPTVIVDTAATSATINTTAKSTLALTGSTALKTVTLTGAGDLTLGAVTPTTVTTIDGSAATGAVTLGVPGTSGVSDTVTSIKTGTGGDTVVLASSNATGLTVSLGAGNDKVLATAAVSNTLGTIDGGDGVDTVSTVLFNTAANVSKFVNFEKLDLTAGNTSFDVSTLPTSNVIAGLTLTGGVDSTTASATTSVLTNVPATAGLSIGGLNTGLSTIGVKGAVAGTADAYTVSFDSTSTTAAAHSGKVQLDGIESLTVASGGDKSTGNTLTLSDNALQSLTITGAKDFTLTLTANGSNTTAAVGLIPTSSSDTVNGVKLIDGSAATGKLTIDASPLTWSTGTPAVAYSAVANAGLTIKGGTGADTITGTVKGDTIIGGGGADVIKGGLGADKITISGTTSTIALTGGTTSGAANDTGTNNATVTQTALLTGALDIITGATAGTKFTFGAAATSPAGTAGIGAFATALTTSTTLATNLQGTDNAVVFARGTYDAANGIFNFGNAGPDTAMTYDWDNSANNTEFHTVILVGYVPSTTTAATTAATGAGGANVAETITLA